MTIKEIIAGLKFTVDMFLLDPSTGETITEPRNDMDKTTIDACKGAIELLDQEPNDDCISREAIKKDLKNCMVTEIRDEDDDLVGYYNADTVDSIVRNLPSVKPQEKMGHWITTRTFMHDGEFYCDKCKCESPNNEKWDYCPNCGCYMVEPHERSK